MAKKYKLWQTVDSWGVFTFFCVLHAFKIYFTNCDPMNWIPENCFYYNFVSFLFFLFVLLLNSTNCCCNFLFDFSGWREYLDWLICCISVSVKCRVVCVVMVTSMEHANTRYIMFFFSFFVCCLYSNYTIFGYIFVQIFNFFYVEIFLRIFSFSSNWIFFFLINFFVVALFF